MNDLIPFLEACKLPVEIAGAWLLFNIRAILLNHSARIKRLEHLTGHELEEGLRK